MITGASALRRRPVTAVAAALFLAGAGMLAVSQRRSRLSGRVRWAPPSGSSERPVLAVRRLGQGTPATVLLHGMFASGRYWGAAYDGLADHGALVVPDLAGFGRSMEADAGFGPDDHADLVARTISEAGAGGQPVVVGAHSLGCLVAVHLARRHPDLVAGIVAFSPPLYRDAASARHHLARANALLALFVLSPAVSEAVCGWMCAHPELAARIGRWIRPDLPDPWPRTAFGTPTGRTPRRWPRWWSRPALRPTWASSPYPSTWWPVPATLSSTMASSRSWLSTTPTCASRCGLSRSTSSP